MIRLTKYTTTQLSTTMGAIFLLALVIVGFGSLSIFKLIIFVIGAYILSLEIAAILFAMRLPAKFFKKFQIEPFYTVNIIILTLFMLDAVRKTQLVTLPLALPLLAALLVGVQFAYYKWFGTLPTARVRVKAKRK